MILGNLPNYKTWYGPWKRDDGEEFIITSILYETPEKQCDYWLVSYNAAHAEWGNMRFQAIIPKRIASLNAATLLAAGPILDQLKSSMEVVSDSGRSIEVVFSTDGWTLI